MMKNIDYKFFKLHKKVLLSHNRQYFSNLKSEQVCVFLLTNIFRSCPEIPLEVYKTKTINKKPYLLKLKKRIYSISRMIK